MPVAKKWSGPSTLDILQPKLDHHLYETTPRVGTQHSPLKGQVVESAKQLSTAQKLLRQRTQGCGMLFDPA